MRDRVRERKSKMEKERGTHIRIEKDNGGKLGMLGVLEVQHLATGVEGVQQVVRFVGGKVEAAAQLHELHARAQIDTGEAKGGQKHTVHRRGSLSWISLFLVSS